MTASASEADLFGYSDSTALWQHVEMKNLYKRHRFPPLFWLK